jgi:hypothetical protein
MSASDAAFLLDALRHVVNPVVVSVQYPLTILAMQKS